MGDMIVLLPGITGSVLAKDRQDVFGLTVGAGLRALFSAGRSLEGLALPGDDPDVDDVDGVEAVRLAPDAHLVPGLWKIDGYGKLARRLRQVPGVELYEFPYDWRRDNRVAARRLQRQADRWLAERRAQDPDSRLVLVAHSMGGLVARYFLEVLGGWRQTRMLITFGTPFRGSLNAVGFLANGMAKAGGIVDLTEVLRSCTSVYQLLPIYPCLDQGDGRLVRLTELSVSVPGIEPDRVAAARAFHQEIEEAVTRNRQEADYSERGYSLVRVVGAEQPTMQSARYVDGRVTLLPTWRAESGDVEDHLGDGTVPRPSASPLELASDEEAFFSGTRHASLQNADAVLTQLLGVLTARRFDGFRGRRPNAPIALDIDDAYAADLPVRVRVRGASPGSLLTLEVQALARRHGEGALVAEGSGAGRLNAPGVAAVEVEATDDWIEVQLPALPSGCYRLVVTGGADPTSDLFVVGA